MCLPRTEVWGESLIISSWVRYIRQARRLGSITYFPLMGTGEAYSKIRAQGLFASVLEIVTIGPGAFSPEVGEYLRGEGGKFPSP